jgi:hypothetical protein
MDKEALLTQLISEYSNDLAALQGDAESERINEIKIFIQQLRVMLAGEAIDVQIPDPDITDSFESFTRVKKRARSEAKGSIGVFKIEREGNFDAWMWLYTLPRFYFKLCCK